MFHSTVEQGMFLVKRGRPDEEPVFRFFSSGVQCSTEQDKSKLEKNLGHLLRATDDALTIEADDHNNSNWCTDAIFAAHPDMKSHARSIFTLGKACVSGSSTKQRTNSRSTNESELAAVDDKIAKVIWSKRLIKQQGFKINLNTACQDNASTLKLMNDRKLSS